MGLIKAGLLERGLPPLIADNRIHVVPSAVVTPEEVGRALDIYDDVLCHELTAQRSCVTFCGLTDP